MTFSFYGKWGFSQHPFLPYPLSGNELGNVLLVGRTTELHALETQFRNSSRIPSVEGPTGVGKTSLINVCVYRMLSSLKRGNDGPFFIPCVCTFQPADLTSLENVTANVFMAAAQTLIQQRSLFGERDRLIPRLDRVDKWLNSTSLDSWTGGLNAFIAGANIGKQVSVNDAEGFLRSGFPQQITTELKRLFDPGEGIVCVLDNMELLDFSSKGKKTLDAMRDGLFQVQGIRFAIAGSRGVVHRILASPRLDGYFHDPLQVGGIDEEHAGAVLKSRRVGFAKDYAVLPICPLLETDFALLHRIQHSNLRSALSLADSYCSYVNAHPLKSWSEPAKAEAFSRWLHDRCSVLAAEVGPSQTRRSWEVFDIAASRFGGSFSPSDCDAFTCNDPANLRAFVKMLEDAGLVVSTIDEHDTRRRHVDFTAKGWFLYYSRCIAARKKK